MTTLAAPPSIAASGAEAPLRLGPRQWLASLAILFVLFAPYQTLVQTVITDDAVRLGIEADEYEMTWVTVAYGVGVLYGVFAGLWTSARIGGRYTLVLGLLVFSAGNLACGAATGLVGLALARLVEGFGKMLVMVVGRATLYKQFDHALLVAIGFYGVFAYSTRYWTPLFNAYLDVWLSWRWMYWAYVPVGLVAAALVWRFIRPDRPPQPIRLPIDWLVVTTFVAWIVAVVFAFGWYRKWGGWSSNEFAATVVLCVALPLVLVARLGSGLSPDEHLKRILRSRVYVLSLMTRGLMLLHMVAVLTIVGLYCTELRGYPRITAWLAHGADLRDDGDDHLPHHPLPPQVAPARLADRRPRRGGGVRLVDVVPRQLHAQGATPRHAGVLGPRPSSGLIPPAFLTDEIEGDRARKRHMLYAGALGIKSALVVPIITVPTATGTVIKASGPTARSMSIGSICGRTARPSSGHRPESPTISASAGSRASHSSRKRRESSADSPPSRASPTDLLQRPPFPQPDDAVRRLGRGDLSLPLRQRAPSPARLRLCMMTHSAMGDTRSVFEMAELRGPIRRRESSRRRLRPCHPDSLLDRRRLLIGQAGRAVVGQALEIGPDQGVVRRGEGAALAAIDLRGQHDDQIAVCPAVRSAPASHNSIRRPVPFNIPVYESQPGVEGRDQPAGHLLRR